MGREHYACKVRLAGRDHFVVWYDDDRDGFLRRADGRLVVSPGLDHLATAAAGMSVALAPWAPTEYDFDRIQAWCRGSDAMRVDCPALLSAWNFFDDLAMYHDRPGTPYARLSRDASRCYTKLFWGNNLPAVTPPGRRFTPTWRAAELEAIRRVMRRGLMLLSEELKAGVS